MGNAAWRGTSDTISVYSDAVSDISTIKIREGATWMWLGVENAAHKALQAFEIHIQPTSDANWVTAVNDASDFTVTPSDRFVEWANRDLCSLALSTDGLVRLHVKGLYAIKLRGQSASGSDTTVDLRWSVR